jgi:CheY-like chemotaxis protein
VSEPGRILIVDDDAAIREALSGILEFEGFVVETAADGAAALARLRRPPAPALVVVDLVMPVMSGWDLCRELSRDAALAALPVVVVSASDRLDQPLPLPHVEVLRKPFRFDRLLASARLHCR